MVGVAGPAVVLERQGVRGGFRRSFRLVRGSFWRVLGVLPGADRGADRRRHHLGAVRGGVDDPRRRDRHVELSLLPQLISGLGQIASGVVTYPIAAGATALL